MLKNLRKKKLFNTSIVCGLLSFSGLAQSNENLVNTPKYINHIKNNLTLDERFETSLFAAPPSVEYVTAVSADIDGTIYVSVDPNGSLGHIKGIGKIVSARDTDGDGKADEFKDFVPHVASPRGGHIVAGTYYLLNPPYLTSYKDTDGDGVADEKKQIVTGFGAGIEHPRGADHTTNGARMGIDGWLYISVGDFGMTDAKTATGETVQLFGGGVARVRPDGSELEVYVHNTRNQFDVAISPTLELFTRDNTNDGKGWNLRIHHQVAESDMGYPRLYQNFPDEHLQSLADYGGGSGMGCLWLDEPGFPKDINNKLYTCDWTSGKVFSFDMKQDDATYKIEQKSFTELVRATDIDVDGQSNLYLADWQGGRFKFEGKGVPVSRIFMAKLKDYQAPRVPDLATASEKVLIEQLSGQSASIRLQAQQYLLKKPLSTSSVKLLEEMVTKDSMHLHVRIAALFTLKQARGVKSHTLCKALLADPAMRIYAMKALTDRKSQLSNLSPDLFASYLEDSNPKVRLQAAISLRRLNKYSKKSVDALIKMSTASWKEGSVGKLGTMALPHLSSRALAGIGQSDDQAWKHYLEVFKNADLKTQKSLTYGLKTIHNKDLIMALIPQLVSADIEEHSRLLVLDVLARLSHKEAKWDLKHWWGTRPNDDGPYYSGEKWEMTKPIISAIEKSFALFSSASQLKVLDLVSKNQIDPSILKLEGVDTLFSALEAKAPNPQFINVLKNVALDTSRDWKIRSKAVNQLNFFQNWQDPEAVTYTGKGKERRKIVNNVLVEKSQEMRKIAVPALLEALTKWESELPSLKVKSSNRDLVEAAIQDYWTAPITMKNDIKTLASIANKVSDGAATLAWKKIMFSIFRPIGERVIEAQQIVEGDIGIHNPGYYRAISDLHLFDELFLQRAKANLNWDYEGTRKAAKLVVDLHEKRKVYSNSPKLTEVGLKKAKEYALINKGDVELGEVLYNKQGCITCHAVNNSGVQKGPFLGNAGSQFTREFLIDSILNPTAAIAQGFPTYQITAKPGKGSTTLGFLVDEDNINYILMNSAGFYEKLVKEYQAKKEIVDISMMPPGLVFSLNLHEFTSLIEYLKEK
ncbi:MAG: hypothetical protein NE330_01300 [Lentisphaeraceae bacterium]|nr:hypothetical protein [Lentisphaeraceae bacterium]